MKNNLRLAFALLAATTLTACASGPQEGDLTGTVGTLYNDGLDALIEKKYDTAVHNFSELERQYPYSGWATRGQILTAYAQLIKGDHEESILTAERFIKLHPGHQNLDYMFYLKGLNHYYRMTDVNRDQGHTRDALEAFQEVVSRYPNSIYARDAKLKITLCEDHLAGKEMAVARFYQTQGQHLAAINRFREVVRAYQTSAQTPEALYRITESYLTLGVTDEATRAAAILGYNYPASPWYQKAYGLLTAQNLAPKGGEKSWAKRVGEGIKDIF